MNKRKYTIADIAEELGVSKMTVSRAINDKDDISKETKKRILDMVEKYNYHPNALAKGMKNKNSRMIGVLIPHDTDRLLMNPFYDEMIRGILNQANKLDYYVLLMNNINFESVIFQDRIDGVLIISPGTDHTEIFDTITQSGLPFVVTSHVPFENSYPKVCVNNYLGALLAIDHLISLGHRKIAFINGPQILASSIDRLRGYKEKLEENNIEFREDMVAEGANTIESGTLEMNRLLRENEITAVFVSGDFMAIGAMNAIKQRGYHIPNDISVVGFDDIAISKYLDPPLTTVRQPILQKAQKAVDLLVRLLTDKKNTESIELDVELIIRGTTAKNLY